LFLITFRCENGLVDAWVSAAGVGVRGVAPPWIFMHGTDKV